MKALRGGLDRRIQHKLLYLSCFVVWQFIAILTEAYKKAKVEVFGDAVHVRRRFCCSPARFRQSDHLLRLGEIAHCATPMLDTALTTCSLLVSVGIGARRVLGRRDTVFGIRLSGHHVCVAPIDTVSR